MERTHPNLISCLLRIIHDTSSRSQPFITGGVLLGMAILKLCNKKESSDNAKLGVRLTVVLREVMWICAHVGTLWKGISGAA